ncbi:MAG: hypothetical protein CMJ81_17575 [Planctomycetaceae bacterium]|nr:hypothetical protein [Planctomycetaceae bacterium]
MNDRIAGCRASIRGLGPLPFHLVHHLGTTRSENDPTRGLKTLPVTNMVRRLPHHSGRGEVHLIT